MKTTSPIQFNLYNVKHLVLGLTVKVWYSLDSRVDGRNCITIYAKGYNHQLGQIFNGVGEYKNDTDMMTDYFDKGTVRIFETDAIYAEARKAVEAIVAKLDAKRDQRAAAKVARRAARMAVRS